MFLLYPDICREIYFFENLGKYLLFKGFFN